MAGQAAVQLFWRAERAAHLGRRRPLARCRTADRLLESDGDLDEAEQVLRAAPDGWCQLALTSQTGKGTPARQPRGNDQFVSGRPMAATGQFCCPPAGRHLAVCGQPLVTAGSKLPREPLAASCIAT